MYENLLRRTHTYRKIPAAVMNTRTATATRPSLAGPLSQTRPPPCTCPPSDSKRNSKVVLTFIWRTSSIVRFNSRPISSRTSSETIFWKSKNYWSQPRPFCRKKAIFIIRKTVYRHFYHGHCLNNHNGNQFSSTALEKKGSRIKPISVKLIPPKNWVDIPIYHFSFHQHGLTIVLRLALTLRKTRWFKFFQAYFH